VRQQLEHADGANRGADRVHATDSARQRNTRDQRWRADRQRNGDDHIQHLEGFSCSLTGFPSTTAITIAHIHIGVAGSAPGAIVVNTGLASGQVTLVNGAGSFQATNINVDPTLAQQIINNPAGYYFNVHSSANPVGVARGQLVRTQ
jgi:hypothetical protein